MSERKALFLLAAALLLTTSASAADVKVAGLQAEDVQTEMTEQGVRFQTSYLDKTVPYKDVFIPESYQDDLNGFSASYKNTSGVTKFSIDFSFNTVKNSSDLPRVLDGYQYQADLMSSQGVTKWSIQSSMDITDNGSEVSLEEDADYDMTLSNNMESANVDGSLNRKVDGSQVLNDAGLNFNASADTFVFDTGLIKPRVSAHYEHLVINYDTRSSVSPRYGKTYDEEENVYSGADPELIPVSGQINKYDGLNTPSDDYVDRFLMRYDRRYEENPHNVTVVIAHPEDEELLSVDLGRNTEELNSSHYSEVVDTAQEVNKTATLLNDTSNYSIKAYNTTIEANSTTPLQYKIDSLENETNDLRMWILGSFAGGSGTSSDPYQIETCQQLQDIQDDLDASYELISDVDCSEFSYSSVADFTGVLDGQGYVVESLTISGGFSNDVGLIGYLGSGGAVKNIGVVNVDNSGSYKVGGLVGYNDGGTISYSYSTGSVSVDNEKGGGLVGYNGNDGTVSYSYSMASVSGGYRVGGLVGQNQQSTVSSSYSTGDVSGNGDNVGGLIGYDFGTVSDSYWDTESSGQSTSGGSATGLTTSEMRGQEAETNMGGFDFTNVWETVNSEDDDATADGYPILKDLDRKNQIQAQNLLPNSAPVVDALNSPSDASKVDTVSPSLDVSVSDPDGDSMTVEYFLNGSSIGSNTGVSSGSSSSIEASGLQWGTQYEWYVTVSDGNGGSTTSSTYQFTTQKVPVFYSASWNDRNIEYGDTVRLLANVSDPDGSVVATRFTGENASSTVFSMKNGTQVNSSYWASPPLVADSTGNYSLVVDSAEDDAGAVTSIGNNYSFRITNAKPRITGSEVVVNETNYRRLAFDLDPVGVKDISGFHGLFSAFEFTNFTLKSEVNFPFQASVNVSDSKGAYSGNREVDLSESDTGHRQATDQVSNLSTQYLNQTYTLSNGASSSINYTVELSIPGTLDSSNQWSGLLSAGSSTTHTVESHRDWIVNQSLSTVEKGQRKSRDSSLTSQYVYNWTRLEADLEAIDVPLSNVDLSSTCSIDTTGDISPTDSLLTDECRNRTFGIDHVTETLSEVRPVNDTVRIGSTIKATRTAQVNNTAGLDFQNLSTTSTFNQKACSQENRSIVDLPAEAEKDFTVDYSCSTGSVYGQDYEVLLNTPSSYYDTVKLNFNVKVPSNVTEESTLKVKLDKDNAPEWDNRESSSVDLNASGSGIEINETEESIFVIVPDDYGNSSLHEGTYNGILKYKYRTSSEGGGTDGSSGGSGGSGPAPPPKPTNNTTVKASFDTQQYYEVDYGGTQVKYLTVYNFDKEPNRVTVATRNSTACSFVEVKPAVNVQEPYSENVTTLVPSKTQGTYKQSSSILIKTKFKIPNKEKLRELGLDGKFTCKFDTKASQGDAGPLAVTVKPVQRFDPVQELMKLVPDLPDQLIRSEEVCLSSSLSSAYSYSDNGECEGQVEQVPVPTKDSAGLLGAAVFSFLMIGWIRRW